MGAFISRITRACFLDLNLFNEVRDEGGLTSQAILIIFLSSFAFGLSTAPFFGAWSILFSTLFALMSWVVWAALVYIVAANLIAPKAKDRKLSSFIRTSGFSSSPGVIRIMCFLPLVNIFVLFLALILSIFTMNLAVRSTFYMPGGAKIGLTVVITFLISLVFTWYFFKFLNIPIPFTPRVM